MAPLFKERTLISRWLLLPDYIDFKEYYPDCIDDQINQLIDKKALLTTFKSQVFDYDYQKKINEDELEVLKEIIQSKGYSLYKEEDFKDFIVWRVRK